MGIRVLNPGALTTVQDAGRTGYQSQGMPCSGVMDTDAYRTACMLTGCNHGEAVLECTLFGGSYRFEEDCIIAVTGGDMTPGLNNQPCPMYRAVRVNAGDVLSLGAAVNGCRTYLAVGGGIDVPLVLGSRSTNLKCKIGGFMGRTLAAGDLLPVGTKTADFPALRELAPKQPVYASDVTVRVIEGPQEDRFTNAGLQTFYASAYTVSDQSDRMGCRLNGPAVEAGNGTDIISDGIVFGSVQVTPSGMPIVLLADRQTTGGYAKIATVCSFDLPLLAQVRPGNTVHFRKISIAEAQRELLSNSPATV